MESNLIYYSWDWICLIIVIYIHIYFLTKITIIPILFDYVISYVLISFLVKLKPFFYQYSRKWTPLSKGLKPISLIQNLVFMSVLGFAEVWYDYEIHDENLCLINDKILNSSVTNTPTNSNKDINTPNKSNNNTTLIIDKNNIVEKNCPVLFVGYHSRHSFDLLFFMAKMQTKTIVHDLLCDIPIIGDIVKSLGSIPSRAHHYNNHAEMNFINELISNRYNQPVFILPGGAYDCLKYSHEQGKVLWLDQPGFVRTVVKYENLFTKDLLIIPVYTRNCDKLLYIPSLGFHDFVTDNFRSLFKYIRQSHFYIIPYAFTILSLSFGMLLFPSFLKLDTYFGEPVSLSKIMTDVKGSKYNSNNALSVNSNNTNNSVYTKSNKTNSQFSSVNSDNSFRSISNSNNLDTGSNLSIASTDYSNSSTSPILHHQPIVNPRPIVTPQPSYTESYKNSKYKANMFTNIFHSFVHSDSTPSHSRSASPTKVTFNEASLNTRNNYDENEAILMLTAAVKTSLENLISNVNNNNIDSISDTTTKTNTSRNSSSNRNIIIKFIMYIDCIFKKMLYLFLFSTQNFIFFSSALTFSWLIYFPISLLVYIIYSKDDKSHKKNSFNEMTSDGNIDNDKND